MLLVMDILICNDYKEILKIKFNERVQRNNSYSLGAFARDIGLSPQRLSHIFSGRHGLSPEAASEVAERLGLNPKEQKFFCALVSKKHSRSGLMKVQAEKTVEDIKKVYQEIDMDQFKIISDWYHFAIMELTLLDSFEDSPEWISDVLGITLDQAQKGIERLLRLELLRKNKQGKLELTGSFFANPNGTPSEAIRNYHRQLMMKGMDALSEQSLLEREFSSNIYAIDESDIDLVRNEIKAFRENLDRIFSLSSKKTKVYCLGLQFFHLHKNKEL